MVPKRVCQSFDGSQVEMHRGRPVGTDGFQFSVQFLFGGDAYAKQFAQDDPGESMMPITPKG